MYPKAPENLTYKQNPDSFQHLNVTEHMAVAEQLLDLVCPELHQQVRTFTPDQPEFHQSSRWCSFETEQGWIYGEVVIFFCYGNIKYLPYLFTYKDN